MAKEAKARIKINRILEEAGWRFWKYKNKSGELVYLSELTKQSTPTSAGQSNELRIEN